MRLQVLGGDAWQVVAEVDDAERCAVKDELTSLANEKHFAKSVLGFYAILKRITYLGPRSLGTDLYHCVDAKNEIYEFIKGGVRVFCFECEGRTVVCSHIIKKKTQRTTTKDKNQVIALRDRYLKAKSANLITLIPLESKENDSP